MGPPAPVGMGLGMAGGLLLDTLLCLLFFIQHSIMVRRRFRLWLTRTVRADFHGALYAAASGSCLLVVVGLWQPAGSPWWAPGGAVRWAMMAVFLAAGAGAWWGSRSLGEFDALGVKPAMQAFDGEKPMAATPFAVRGPYRWVRHPLYLFSLVIIWSGPVFTAGPIAAQRALDGLDRHRRHHGGAGSGGLFRGCLPFLPENRSHAAAHQPEAADAR
jgi:protein-S-isoprenylcysteine O-methyltransferase Ste14